jgi:putative transposase
MQNVFFSDRDKLAYTKLLHKEAERFGINIWAYCLMDNHIHLIAVPKQSESLESGVGEAHRKYSRMINLREHWKGHLWQERFFSCPLDRKYLYYAVRYVELNPVRAGLVKRAEEYPWSSAKAHIHKIKDILLSDEAFVTEIGDWNSYLSVSNEEEVIKKIRKHVATGRPLGEDQFIHTLEKLTGRTLKKKKPGPKKKNQIELRYNEKIVHLQYNKTNQ